MKKVLIASSVAVMAFAMVAAAQGTTFNTNLTVGSTGSDVVALQTWLIQNGYSIPSIASGAAAKGYFGSQTKTAVMQYQAANGIPNTGFVGPLTRAKLNGGSSASGSVSYGCPAGYTCTPIPGSQTTTPVVSGPTGITTPGVPGIMSVTSGPLSSSVVNVGATMVPVLTIRVQAQYSDLAVQSINLDLGNNTAAYNKIFNKLYVTDGTNVLASQNLNSATVIQSGSDYIVGINGFNFIVPKGTYKDITIKADLYSSIDSTYITAGQSHFPGNTGPSNGINSNTFSGWAIGLNTNGLRAVDGAGINLNSGTGFYQTLTINPSLVDNAQANISLDPSSPLAISVPVSDTTNSQYLGLPVMAFSVNAQNDTLHLHEVKVNFGTSGTGNIGAAYLFQGSTQVSSASVSNGQADFANITDGTAGATIPVNTSLPFTIKVDVTGVTNGSNPFKITPQASSTLFTIYSSNDSTATVSGNAIGNPQTVSAVGPLFTLVGTPTITSQNITAGGSSVTTFKYTATFNVNVQAVGTDVYLGLPASTSVNGGSFGTSSTGINIAQVFENGVASTTRNVIASYSMPSNTTSGPGANSFTVSRNQSVTIPVTYTFTIVNTDPTQSGNVEAVQMQGINWSSSNGANGPTTFMANQTAWRTPSI